MKKDYFLSVSRSLSDNKLYELCESFSNLKDNLVLISNFSKSEYGNKVYEKFSSVKNLWLIDGLYIKPELDLIRRKCKAYIHTHTLCGTAPSLVEMIVCKKPIISIDIPQNRFTLSNEGFYFKNFTELKLFIENNNFINDYICSENLVKQYSWNNIVNRYESIL